MFHILHNGRAHYRGDDLIIELSRVNSRAFKLASLAGDLFMS